MIRTLNRDILISTAKFRISVSSNLLPDLVFPGKEFLFRAVLSFVQESSIEPKVVVQEKAGTREVIIQ